MNDKQYIQSLRYQSDYQKRRAVMAMTYLNYAKDAITGAREGGIREALGCIDDAYWELKRTVCDHNRAVEVREGDWFCPDCNPHAYEDGKMEAQIL